jgi:DNA-binding transcriptional LysR family regulator
MEEGAAAMIDLKHVRAFLAVARTGGFTAAALELHYSQSTITEQVKGLENELGRPLFDRTGRRPVLTAAGQALLPHAEQMLVLSDRARAAVRTAQDDVLLTIGALETLCAHLVPDLLARFRRAEPAARVVVRQGSRGEIFDGLHRQVLDVGLTFGPPSDPELVTRVLRETPLVVVAPPGHRLAAGGPVGRADLAGAPFLATEPGCGFREMYDTAFADVADGPALVAEVASMAALRGLVASGMGLALLPEMVVAEHLARGEVVALALTDDPALPPGRTTVNLTWRPREQMPVGLEQFLAVTSELSGSPLGAST